MPVSWRFLLIGTSQSHVVVRSNAHFKGGKPTFAERPAENLCPEHISLALQNVSVTRQAAAWGLHLRSRSEERSRALNECRRLYNEGSRMKICSASQLSPSSANLGGFYFYLKRRKVSSLGSLMWFTPVALNRFMY